MHNKVTLHDFQLIRSFTRVQGLTHKGAFDGQDRIETGYDKNLDRDKI